MPITIIEEEIDEELLWSSDGNEMIFCTMNCPFCKSEQVFRNSSIYKCSDCTKPIIDGFKLKNNIVYRVGFHLSFVTDKGEWTQDWSELMTLRKVNE